MRIGIDAGHGGSSSGTYSCNTTKDGLFEKDYALEVALLVKEALLRNEFEVVMTRETDKNPGTVDKRAKKMADAKVDFALSLHFNGFQNKAANGCEVFVPYGEKYANIEVGFYKVLTKYFKAREPFARANSIYDRNIIFDKHMNPKTNRFDDYDVGQDYFGFIRNCWKKGITADLLEICFLTNPGDFKAFTENKKAIAEGIAKSIVEGYGRVFVPEKKPKSLNLKKVNLI